MLEKKMLFAPGPVITDKRIKEAALAPDLCHRMPMFEGMYGEVRDNLIKLFNAAKETHTTFVVSGSGTSSNETVLSSVVEKGKKVLLITNGAFGNRLRDIIECYGMGLIVVEHEWAEVIDLRRVEDELKKDKDISLISMVFHETSTGMVNPVHEVGILAKKYDKMFHVDTVSAIGGEDIDVVRDNIDFCNGVPNKAVGGQPGVAFVCVRRTALEKIQNVKRRNIYLNLQHHVREAEEHNQTPNTPSVVMFITLNEALKVLFEEGQKNVITRYKENAAIIRKGFKDLGLKFLLNDEKLMSNTVTSVFLPTGINVDDFLDKMDKEGYVIYKGKGPLIDKNLFQAANMGQIHADDSREFIKVIGRVLAEMSKK